MVEFKPSFIPQKPIAAQSAERRRHVGVFDFVTYVLFFAAIAGAGGLFLYRAYLANDLKSKSSHVARAKDAVEISVIDDLQKLDSRIAAARQLLNKHVTVSPVFDLLEATTLTNSVRLSTFNYALAENTVSIKVSGEARNYSSLAVQSKVFGENKFLRNQLVDGLKLGPKGFVSFNFSADMEEEFALFRNNLSSILSATTTARAVPAATTTTSPSPTPAKETNISNPTQTTPKEQSADEKSKFFQNL